MTIMTMMKACLFVAFCGVAVTSAFAPAAPLLRDQHHHHVSLNNMHRPNHVQQVTKLWGTSSSPESETGRSSRAVQLPKAIASFCVASLLAVSLLAGPNMAVAATKVAPEPPSMETVKSNKKESSSTAKTTAPANKAPAESIAVDNAKATLAADKSKVADLMTQLKKAKTENDSALADANKAEVAAERAKVAYIKANDRLVSLPTSATVNTILAEKEKVAQLKQVSSDASLALSKAKTAQKATAGRLSTLESDVVKAQKIVEGAEKTVQNAELKYKKYQADKVEQERKAAIERKQAQEAAKKKQAEQKKKAQQAAEKLKKEQEKARQKAKAEAKKAAERQRKVDEANSKKRQEQAKKDAKKAKEVAERTAKELRTKIELAKKKVEQFEQEKRKLIVQENVPKSKIEAMEKKLQGAREELKAVMKSPGK